MTGKEIIVRMEKVKRLVVNHDFRPAYAQQQIDRYDQNERGIGMHDATLVVCSDVDREYGEYLNADTGNVELARDHYDVVAP